MSDNALDALSSYLLGLFQTDAHKSVQGSCVYIAIELSNKDKNILTKIKNLIAMPTDVRERTRNTNFKNNYTSNSLQINGKYIPNIIQYIPSGKKFALIEPPPIRYS